MMALESENSVIESVEDNEVIIPSENTIIHSNGDCGVEHVREVDLGEVKSEGFPSSGSGSMGTNSQVKKGYGLKKWKRMPRESSKERGNSMDNGTAGKREFSNVTPDSRKGVVLAETKQRSEGSVSSTNGVLKSSGLFAQGFGSGLEVGLGPVFDAVADSENSEDHSSKSSTAASAPQQRLEIPLTGGSVGDSNGFHDLAAQRGQHGRNRTGTGKKARAEQAKIEKENSYCSVESDSQGSNFVFMQGANSVTSKGRQSKFANCDGENSDEEGQGSEQHFAEELQSGFRKNMAEFEEVSQTYLPADLNWKTKEENCVNNGSSVDQDPLLESITRLQSAQEALAEEVQKFKEIGKDDIFFFSDVIQDANPSSLEGDIVNVKQNVNVLESKLEEARSTLEPSLTSTGSIQKENIEMSDLEQRISREVEDLEGLFKQRIEAMVEYLVTSKTIEDLRLAAVSNITFLEEQKLVAIEQAQVVSFSESVGYQASMPKRGVDKLETQIETGENMKLKKRTCNFALLFFIQFVLLCVALWFFVLQLVPCYTENVPT
ncbi:WPP domain-interacting protein 2 isoform X2 [Daucus carota subsp. sativus]|nr:PREDICTED: WPP domain-interacting protein 2 isoform X2 [Daucus carota subsp. sativus]XP_017253626.1 PREDICTED: WPP domain-interacting protein 2 isoform X2 [Daucus carota subsp. sativus]